MGVWVWILIPVWIFFGSIIWFIALRASLWVCERIGRMFDD